MESCCPDYVPGSEFVDTVTGDCICTRCGRVLESHMILENLPSYADCMRTGAATEYEHLESPWMQIKGVHKSVIAQSLDSGPAEKKGCDMVIKLGKELDLVDRTVSWAKELMRDALGKEQVRAQQRLRSLGAGCLYFACKLDGVDRGENEIADRLGIDRKNLQKSNKKLRALLAEKPYARTMLHGVRPSALIPRMLQAVLGLTDMTSGDHRDKMRLRARVESLAADVERVCCLDGKKPQSVCAAMIALVFEKQQRSVPLSRLAAACGVSVGALDGSLQELRSLVQEKKILM